jgi:sugar transferase (PEP-CTERM/EpsH1 system associated)
VNGVDTEFFSPDRGYERPYTSRGPILVFTGMMDYWANGDAVAWFARECFPEVRRALEDARFFIVGARPTRAVERLSSIAGVEVTGAVEDIRPYLAHADLAVAPLRVARGIQNKVLEAMAMARPVVATPDALEGLGLPDELRWGGNSAEEFHQAVTSLLRSAAERRRIGELARNWVLARHDWARTLRPMVELIESEGMHERA